MEQQGVVSVRFEPPPLGEGAMAGCRYRYVRGGRCMHPVGSTARRRCLNWVAFCRPCMRACDSAFSSASCAALLQMLPLLLLPLLSLAAGDLTSHPLVHVRPSTADPGHGMVSLGPDAQQLAAEQGAVQAVKPLPASHAGGGTGAQLAQAPVTGAPGAAAAVTAAGAADARATMPTAEGHHARGNSSLAGSSAAQQQQLQLPEQAQQQQQLLRASAQHQRQPSAKDVFRLATHVFRSNVLGRK